MKLNRGSMAGIMLIALMLIVLLIFVMVGIPVPTLIYVLFVAGIVVTILSAFIDRIKK